MPVYFGNTVVLRHPSHNLDPATIRMIMIHSSCNSIITTPATLSKLGECPRTLALLRSLESVVIGGTNLTEECNELLCHPGVTIQNICGYAETFPLVQRCDQKQDSYSLGFHEVSGAAFHHHPRDYQSAFEHEPSPSPSGSYGGQCP